MDCMSMSFEAKLARLIDYYTFNHLSLNLLTEAENKNEQAPWFFLLLSVNYTFFKQLEKNIKEVAFHINKTKRVSRWDAIQN